MARESGGGAVNDVSELDYNTQPWRLDIEKFRLPRESHDHPRHDSVSSTSLYRLLPASRKQRKVSEYYKKQERLLEEYNEMEVMTESGCFPVNPTEDEMKQLAKSERLAIQFQM